jgi:hypothetical protein
VGYRNAKLNSDGVPTNINKSIPLGVSFKTADGQVLFSRLKPQGGCPWCLDPEPHSNIRTKGGPPTPQCIYSKYCRCCGVKFKDLLHNKYGEKHNCTASGVDKDFYDPPKLPKPVAPTGAPAPTNKADRPFIHLSESAQARLAKRRKIQEAAIGNQRQAVDQVQVDRLERQRAHQARMAQQQAEKQARIAAKRPASDSGEEDGI